MRYEFYVITMPIKQFFQSQRNESGSILFASFIVSLFQFAMPETILGKVYKTSKYSKG